MSTATFHADGRFVSPYVGELLPLCRSLPGAKWDKLGRAWRFSTAASDRRRLLQLAEQMRPVLERAGHRLHIDRDLYQDSGKRARAQLQRLAERTGLQPYPFQITGVEWLSARPKALLADDMGLGKTMQVLCSLPERAATVVICPASLKHNWAEEVGRWRSDLRAEVLSGWGSFRAPRSGEVLITNYELLPPPKPLPRPTVYHQAPQGRLCRGAGEQPCAVPPKRRRKLPDGVRRCWVPQLARCSTDKWRHRVRLGGMALPKPPRRPWEPDATTFELGHAVLVVDEASYIKGTRSARHKSVRELAKRAARVWLLTGTPLMNRPLDLWGVCSAGGLQHEAFDGWGGFTRGFHAYKNRFGGWQFGMPTRELHLKLGRVMLRRRKEEVLTELPRLRFRTLVVDAPVGTQLKLKLEEAWRQWVPEEDDRPIRLPDFTEFSELRAALATARIPAMVELIEQYEEAGEPLLVFSAHRQPIEKLAGRQGWATILGGTNANERQRICERFRAGQLRGVGLTISAGGYGLNLQATGHVLFVDMSWVPGENNQAIDRARRIGATAESILVTRLVSDHPLDRHVLRLLDEKEQLVEAAVEGRTHMKETD
jgi:SWI/SNF-related matrix-associated actin-dependent regulator 1 of chromatin subfamily A